jgi:hypothetical protein
MKNNFLNNNSGFIALSSILIFGTVIFIIGLTASIGSLFESRMSLSFQDSNQSLSLANLCAEKAIWELMQNENYEGDEEVLIDNHSCTIYPIEWWQEDGRIIVSEGEVGEYRKRIRVTLSQLSPELVIDSWEDVLEF